MRRALRWLWHSVAGCKFWVTRKDGTGYWAFRGGATTTSLLGGIEHGKHIGGILCSCGREHAREIYCAGCGVGLPGAKYSPHFDSFCGHCAKRRRPGMYEGGQR